jgi:hypothetical protein
MTPEFTFLQCIAALPGYFVLSAVEGGSGQPEHVHKEPIVAWAIEEESYVPYPITYDGVDTKNSPVLRPDGSVAIACSAQWLDVDDWMQTEKEESEARRKHKRWEEARKQAGI